MDSQEKYIKNGIRNLLRIQPTCFPPLMFVFVCRIFATVGGKTHRVSELSYLLFSDVDGLVDNDPSDGLVAGWRGG